MRAIVAGATGFTGREVVRQLRDRDIAVTAHIRPGSAAAGSWVESFRSWGADVAEVAWEPADLTALVARVQPTHVFSLIGTARAGQAGQRRRR
jgi:nucleoside-diphosphate-sugar epimerase